MLVPQGLPWKFSGEGCVLLLQGGEGSIPGQGTKISPAAGQLCPHAATTEAALCNERPPCGRESSHVTVKTQFKNLQTNKKPITHSDKGELTNS